MSSSLHLVDPELHPLLEAMQFDLSDETLAADLPH